MIQGSGRRLSQTDLIELDTVQDLYLASEMTSLFGRTATGRSYEG